MNTKTLVALTRGALAASMILLSGLAGAATVNLNLTAQRMNTSLPDGASVPMWGYCTTGSCTGSWAPGPTIVVPVGDTLTINLTNSLPVPTSLVILGQLGGGLGNDPSRMPSPSHNTQNSTTWPGNGAPDVPFTPPAQGQRVMSFATEVAPSPTATATALTWTNLKPGTYLYETGTLPSIQAPMGLYGVLIVTQAPVTGSPGKAYPGKPNEVAYDSETSLLFSEIDPVQNKAVDAAAVAGTDVKRRFDDASCAPKCYPAAVNYTPTYFLINGKAFDQTKPQNSAFAVAGTNSAPGIHSTNGSVLVRLLNAGLRTHVPSIVGLPMAIVAEDGNVAPGKPKLQNEVLLTAGKTHDVLVTPASSAGTYSAASFPLFDRQLSLTTGNTPGGGMQGFLQVASAGAASNTAGALPSAVTPTAVNDSFQVPLNASINGNVKLNDIAVTSAVLTVGNDPLKGTLVFNVDGTFVYTPATGVNHTTDTFKYKGNGGSTNEATVTLAIASTGVGEAPIVSNDSYTSTVSTKFSTARPGVLANDKDPTGYPLTAALVAKGDCGSVSMSADGSFSATKGTANACTFTYMAKNSQGTTSAAANVTVTFVPAGKATGLNVAVFDPASSTPVADYRWIIQEDLTFKVDPTGTPSVSTRTLGTSFHRSHMNVVATGCVGPISCGKDQQIRTDTTTRDATTGTLGARHVVTEAEALALQTMPDQAVLDPTKHYYISILPGDAGAGGHGMGGAEIKPQVAGAWASVSIAANAYDWVPAQLSIYIYEDNAPVNGQNDLNEVGLGGFNIILMDAAGRSGDVAGQQTYDSYGMPLSNALLGRPGCPDDQNANTYGKSHDGSSIVGLVYTCPNAPDGYTGDPATYALAGHALILNVTPARYDVIAHPAAARQGAGEIWWQTETLEGTSAQDAFAGVKEPVYFQEFGPPGFHTTIGFVNPNRVAKYASDNGLTGSNTITGRITNQRMSHPSNVALFDSGSYDLLSSTTCQVALNSEGGDGAAIAITQCNPDGSFTLTNVPTGSYELMVWDQWLDQIIQAVAVTVPEGGNKTVAMGNLPVLSWFTQYDQNIFMDANKNGKYDDGEKGISNVTMTTRYRDGGISNQTATDSNGNGLLAELFPLFNWYVTEADTTRFKQTGVNVIVDGGGQVDAGAETKCKPPQDCSSTIYSSNYATGESSNRVELPGAYSYGLQGFISQRNTINWGRAPYATNENGGIQGVVVYSTTRPFDDQRYNVQTLWEPLVPRVTVNLYRREKLADGTLALTKIDSTLTSSFDDWVNAVKASDNNIYILGQDGVLRDPTTGVAAASGVTAGAQVNLQCPGQLPGPATGALPPFDLKAVDPFTSYTLADDSKRCYDGWHNWNQVQAAPYDGRYNFPSAAYIAAHPLTTDQIAAGQTLVSLPPGDYVVESVTPAGFEVVKEEDKNILNGDSFVAPAVTQFGGIGNIFILPDQATLNNANPYNLKNADGIANNATNNLGATASWAVFPECVGNMHLVPDYLSLFPAGGLVSPFAGMERPLCDRKLVKLGDQMQASANFFVFTQVPMAANGTGIILDDATSEFNVAAPDFGEKASVPFVPVSVKDFNGREISRLYADQWGAFNMLTPSSWLVNPPTPSGYGPNMLVTCMNDPGPIKDPVTGQMVTDPQYNPAYSNFCYTLPFMPGRTTYLDTPVLPIAAFAAGYNPADCDYPDATPAIARVDGDGFGPYVAATGKTLTITALGDRKIQNPAYAGPFALTGPASQRTITRHYGFGTNSTGKGKVTVNGVAQTVTGWSDTTITVTVPAGTTTGQLVVTADNGVSSIDTVTVTVEAKAPKRVQGANGDSIQAAVDAATPGDLILVDAGVYNELVIMWKPVRLQGVGAASVIINAAKYPTSKLEAWRPVINSLFSVDVTTGNSTATALNPSQIDALPTQEITGGLVLLEPSVLGTEQGPGITVLAKNLPASECSGGATSTFGHLVTESNFLCAASRIDGVSVTGGDSGGGVYVNGWAHNLEISNNRVYGNAGALNGGVRIGVPYLEIENFPVDNNGNISTHGGQIDGFGYDSNVKIHHNAITKNGTVESSAGAGGAGGGVSICTGTDGYSVDHNWICGNYSASDGGGIGHIGFSQNGRIANNQILFNQTFQQTGSTHGGGIMVVGEPPVAGTLSLGTGNVTIDANVIRGNSAEGGHGGGVRLQQVNGADVAAFPATSQASRWHKVTMTNNMVVNNEAGWAGGGIAIADTLNSSVVNNTVASNDSTGIAGVLLTGGVPAQIPAEGVKGTTGKGRPNPAGISSEPTSQALRSAGNSVAVISHPELTNNIIWKNRSFYYDGTSGTAKLCANNGTDTTCSALDNQATTGQCDKNNARYWDLGVLGATSVNVTNAAQPAPYAAATVSQATAGNVRTVTITLALDSNLGDGQQVSIAGFTGTNANRYNGTRTITLVGADTITFTPASNGVTDANFLLLGMANITVTPLAVNFPGNAALNPTYSIMTSLTGYPGAGNSAADPQLTDLYCNGSRVTPEFAGVINPPSVKNLQVAATTDEGNNYVSLRYGPLSTMKPNNGTGTSYVSFGDYHLGGLTTDQNTGLVNGSTSPAFHMGTTVALTHDVDGDVRPAGTVTAGQVSGFDKGADQVAFPAPKMVVSPSPTLAFGNVSINTFQTRTVTVTNDVTATANLVLAASGLAGDTTRFTMPATTCVSGAPGLAPGASCVISVTFTPGTNASTTVRSATLSVNTTNASSQVVALSGTGSNPSYAITPGLFTTPLASGHNFGNQAVGTSSTPFQFVLAVPSNSAGEVWLNGNPVLNNINPLSSNFANQFQARFSAATGDTCTNATHLAPGASCTFSVVFTPTSIGAKGTVTTILGADAYSAGAYVDVAHVNGAVNLGGLPSPVIGAGVALTGTLLPNPLAFGNQFTGSSSAVKVSTFTYNGAGSITLTSNAVSISGGNANQFSQTNTCNGATLATGNTCTINVTFTPTSNGGKNATLNVGSDSATLSGTGGTSTNRTVTPAILNGFGTVVLGGQSTAQTVTMTNTGFTAIAVTSISFTGTNPTYWTQTNTCGTSIPVNGSCAIAVKFAPPAAGTAGAKSATLSIVDGVSATTRQVTGTAS